MRSSVIAAMLAAFLSLHAYAATIEQPLANPSQEAAARSLFQSMKCVVCEGQSLADSDAKLAQQMRAHIRAMLADGKSERDVLTFFQRAYGEHILMTPQVKSYTLLLWLMPLLLLTIGALFVWRSTYSHASKDNA